MLLFCLAGLLVAVGLLTYYYVRFSRLIDARLSGDIFNNASLVFSAPTPISVGQAGSPEEVANHLRRALYAEGTGQGSWQALAFGWVRYLFGDSQALHTWHHLAMWALLCYVIIHLYLVFRQEIMTDQSYVSTMISGYRSFKD